MVVTGVSPRTNMKPEAKLGVANQIAPHESGCGSASGVPGYEINITFDRNMIRVRVRNRLLINYPLEKDTNGRLFLYGSAWQRGFIRIIRIFQMCT